MHLEACAPIFGAAQRVAFRVGPEVPERYVTRADAKRSKTANQTGPEVEVVDDPQIVAAERLQVAGLEMDEADDLVVDIVIITKIAGRAHIARVAARAGGILFQFGIQPSGWIFDVVDRIEANRVAKLGGQEGAFRLFDRQRCFSIRQAVIKEVCGNSW